MDDEERQERGCVQGGDGADAAQRDGHADHPEERSPQPSVSRKHRAQEEEDRGDDRTARSTEERDGDAPFDGERTGLTGLDRDDAHADPSANAEDTEPEQRAGSEACDPVASVQGTRDVHGARHA